MTTVAERLAALGIRLPAPPEPVGNYVPVAQVGNLVYTSGMIPLVHGEVAFKGKLGQELDLKKGQAATRIALFNALAAIQAHLGTLDRVTHVVRLNGSFVVSRHFYEHAKVLNAASEFLVDLFGEQGKHSRTAIGVRSLPLRAAVMLDLILSVHEP